MSGDTAAALRALPPVPACDGTVSTAAARAIPVDRAHPLHDEPLASIRAAGIAGEAFYHRDDGGNAPYGRRVEGSIAQLLARRSVVARLRRAEDAANRYGFALWVWDGWRPVALQRGLRDFFARRFREETPGIAEDELRRKLAPYVSDPAGFAPRSARGVPAHASGGAVDCTLRRIDADEPADLGCPFDTMDARAHADWLERRLADGAIAPDDPALLSRRLLHHAMSRAGFVNHPAEYWHFDWGNALFVANGGDAPSAWYGYIEP